MFNCIYSVCDIPLKYMYGLDSSEEATISLNLLPLVLKQTYAFLSISIVRIVNCFLIYVHIMTYSYICKHTNINSNVYVSMTYYYYYM